MFKVLICLVVLGTVLADDDDRFDDSREIRYVVGSPLLKSSGAPVGVPLIPRVKPRTIETKVVAGFRGFEPDVKSTSDVEVVHVDQSAGSGKSQQPSKVGTVGEFHAPFFIKIDDDDDDDDDNRVFFRSAGISKVPLTYSRTGPYNYKFKYDDDDDDRHSKIFFRSFGIPLPYTSGYRYVDNNDRKVVFRSAANVGTPAKYSYTYRIDDDDDDLDDSDERRTYFRKAGKRSPITYSSRYRYFDDDDDDDLFDFDDK